MNSEKQAGRIVALRLYFPRRSRINATRFWHRLSAPALAQHLLITARRAVSVRIAGGCSMRTSDGADIRMTGWWGKMETLQAVMGQ